MSTNGDGKRTCFLVMPGYGHQTAGAGRAFWRASSGRLRLPGRATFGGEVPLQLVYDYAQASLLAHNFNRLWCAALNRVHRGEHIDYFAMLHADVEPVDFWLDTLIRELEIHNLDIIGAVVPLKDPHGLTSLALARPDGDPWRVHCRLTMTEVYRLPETFTSDDVGHPLLLNTGCWVCRFDESWAKNSGFTINDRIRFSTTKNEYVAEVEPEDWFFSRGLHQLGLKVGATRKVALEHVGDMRFTNGYPWGSQAFDSEYVTESVVPEKATTPGFKFPADVDGWLLPVEGEALADLARDKRVLEIGSYCGRSTICLAQTASEVLAVDPFDGRGTPKARDTFAEFNHNLDRYGIRNVEMIHPEAEIKRPGFDLAFIDGAHDHDSVRRDIDRVLSVLNPGGLIAFHDYRQNAGDHDGRWDPGVTQAVNELVAAGGEILSTHATLAVVRPPANVPLEV